jgi:soluble lytic murein transglycosylase-like protein
MKRIATMGLMVALLTACGMAENSYSNAPTSIPTNYRKPRVSKLPPVYVYTYAESAHQQLPNRVILAPQIDPVTREKVTVPTSLSNLICNHARSYDIDPLIIDILTRHESGFNPTAVSRAGARGLMQLMPETAASLGVTDIEDPDQNVAAGTRYLVEQVRRYGDLQLALAAYNAGPTCVDNCGGIPPYAETQNYVASITSEYLRLRKRKS